MCECIDGCAQLTTTVASSASTTQSQSTIEMPTLTSTVVTSILSSTNASAGTTVTAQFGATEPMGNGALIGGIVGMILALLLLTGIVAAIVLVRRRQQQTDKSEPAQASTGTEVKASARDNVYGSFIHPNTSQSANRPNADEEDVQPRTYGSLGAVTAPTSPSYSSLPNHVRYESPDTQLHS
jgi:predicted lipid-binding transport protein (Tim44 family)